MQFTKSELIQKLADRGIKAKSTFTKAQLQELYEFEEREEVKPAPQADFVIAPNGLKLSIKSAKDAGLI